MKNKFKLQFYIYCYNAISFITFRCVRNLDIILIKKRVFYFNDILVLYSVSHAFLQVFKSRTSNLLFSDNVSYVLQHL